MPYAASDTESTTFSAFFRAHHDTVVATAERRLGSVHDAEEIAARAFQLAWERHSHGPPPSMPWLGAVVRNLVGDEYRHRARRAELQRRLGDECSRSAPFSAELRADLRDAVDRLPPAHREVLRLHYGDGLTAGEIATALGSTPGAIRARLMRARRLLRAALTEDSGDAGGGPGPALRSVRIGRCVSLVRGS